MDKKQKIIVISGGSRGLGQALVTDLLAQGHIVTTFSRSQTPFISECLSKEPFHWESVDATDLERVKQFALSVTRRYGQIDVLINNAAIGVDGILTLMRSSEIERGLTINLTAVIHLTQTCLKSMLQQQSGCVINITSINGLRGYSGVSVYSATKAALDGMTRSLAREMGPQGIRFLGRVILMNFDKIWRTVSNPSPSFQTKSCSLQGSRKSNSEIPIMSKQPRY